MRALVRVKGYKRRKGGFDFGSFLKTAQEVKPITQIRNLGNALGVKIPGKFGSFLSKAADIGQSLGFGRRRKHRRHARTRSMAPKLYIR
jgi:hypothetical protein